MTLDPSAFTWQRRVTEIIMLVFPSLLIAWDFFAVFTTSANATISEIFIHFAYEHPVAALYIGMLFGHLTFPASTTRPHWETAIIVTALVAIGIAVDRMRVLPMVMPVIPLVLGIFLGHLAWPQRVTTETGASLVLQTSGTATIQTRRVTQTINGGAQLK